MTNKVKTLVMSAALIAAGALGMTAPVSAAFYCPDGTLSTTGDTTGCGGIKNQNNQNNLMSVLNTIINVVIGVVGFLAVVMIIYGGVQYTMSAGAADKVKSAKDTIMYGIIGLVVALLAFAIVNFVLGSIFK
ncbi:hypothetical protein IKG54_00390 [Candidatus Saccharibacteria bacterium]|nr:hypothetical protein [Candidatus Saccharibacteria bacterium]